MYANYGKKKGMDNNHNVWQSSRERSRERCAALCCAVVVDLESKRSIVISSFSGIWPFGEGCAKEVKSLQEKVTDLC